MLDSIRFVKGAVASKDFVPSLTHFWIEGGFIYGFNGMLGLCAPIDLDLKIAPKAVPFIKAIQTCKDTISLHVTAAGKLSVKSGKFKAFVECDITESFPPVVPEGEKLPVPKGFVEILKELLPFIAEDASRAWARGIFFKGESAFATNNIVIIEKWLGFKFPVEANIPKSTVAELVRIGEDPVEIQVGEGNVTFHFEGNRFLKTQTYSTDWPDLSRVLDIENNQTPIPETLFESLADIKPFADDLERIYFTENGIATHLEEGVGAAIEVENIVAGACFNHHHLTLLEGIAKTIDFSAYPKPSIFYGDKLRGAIAGMRYGA